MKITDIETNYIPVPYPEPFNPAWSSEPVRRLGMTVLKIYTDEGITGIAGTHSHGGAQAPPEDSKFDDTRQLITVERYIKPRLLGEDPLDINRHLQVVRAASLFGSIPWFVMVGLWDIVGKACGQPLYRLWGGARKKVKAYASTVKLCEPEQRARFASEIRSKGFKGVKLRFHRDHPREDLEVFNAVKEATGEDMAIMVDANQNNIFPYPEEDPLWDYSRAYEVARALDGKAEWLEEPLPAGNKRDLARLKENFLLPIAGGEGMEARELSKARELVESGRFDIIQPDPLYAGGYFHVAKIAAIAESYNVKCNPHCWSNGLGLAANLHLASAIPNCDWVEYPYDPPYMTKEVFQRILKKPIDVEEDGYITIPDKPGLGVELDEELVVSEGRGLDDF